MQFNSALTLALVVCALSGNPAMARSDNADLASTARWLLGVGQGVYVECSDGTVLLAQAAGEAVHPASVSKVPTTLALLRRLGPNYRFTTTVAVTGGLQAGTVGGDLLIEGGGDPYFVDENALLVAGRLRQLGVRHIAGALRTSGELMFNWRSDALMPRLRAVLTGTAPAAAWASVRSAFPGLADFAAAAAVDAPGSPALTFGDMPLPASTGATPVTLLTHHSQPLVPLVKALNDFSNNIFKPLADAAGGAEAVQTLARAAVPESMRAEITLVDGAGTDARNRLSPRAAVKLLRALELELQRSGHTLVDILPVAGVDEGTLRERLNGPNESGRIVGKTGTFGDYGASALAGAIRTTDRGTVYFAILNHGVPVPLARKRQDAMVRALLAHLHTVPWVYVPDARPAISRAEVLADGASGSRRPDKDLQWYAGQAGYAHRDRRPYAGSPRL